MTIPGTVVAKCSYHKSVTTDIKCSRCKKPICSSCKRVEDGAIYCITCSQSNTRKLQQDRIEKWLKQAANRQKRAYTINQYCHFHPDKDAEAICSSCAKPICYSCTYSDKDIVKNVFCKECWKDFLASPKGMKSISKACQQSTLHPENILSKNTSKSIIIKDEPKFKRRIYRSEEQDEDWSNKSIHSLIYSIRNEDSPAHRRVAALLLGKSKDKMALEHLIYVIRHDNDKSVRKQVAEAILELNDKDALVPLLQILKTEPDPEVRKVIAFTYSRLRYQSS